MPFGYLIPLILVGICCLVALIRPRRMSRKRYLLTVAISELPQAAALLVVLATALTWSEGDLAGPGGLLPASIAALVLLGLAALIWRGVRAGPAVDAVVREQGGNPGRHLARRLLRPLLFPFPWRPRSVTRIGPISYGAHRRQRLDIYRPKDPARPGPVLVYFHGGGYFSGSNRREGRALLHHLAARGWVCLSASYRVRPKADFTDHLDDARAVLRWAHDHPAVHGGDPDMLVMAGSSAGAHLTALCALTQDRSRPDRPRVDAAICLYGYYRRYYGRGPDESPVSTPLALNPAQAPPFFIAHGDHDCDVPVEDARALARYLASGSPGETWYVELPGAQHGFDIWYSWRIAAVIDGIDAFLDRVHSSLSGMDTGFQDFRGNPDGFRVDPPVTGAGQRAHWQVGPDETPATRFGDEGT